MKEEAIHKYYYKLLQTPRIQQFIAKVRQPCSAGCDIHRYEFSPILQVVDTLGVNVAGLAVGYQRLRLSRWVLADERVAKGTVRHELAHALKHYARLNGTHHGKEYYRVLRIVSPKKWQLDKYWYPTAKIEEARAKYHKIKPEFRKSRIKQLQKLGLE